MGNKIGDFGLSKYSPSVGGYLEGIFNLGIESTSEVIKKEILEDTNEKPE